MLLSINARAFNTGGRSHNAPSSNIKDPGFRFPKHKELFTDEYYSGNDKQEDGVYSDPESDPYMKPEHTTNDFEQFDTASHKRTNGGVLSSYKK